MANSCKTKKTLSKSYRNITEALIREYRKFNKSTGKGVPEFIEELKKELKF